MIVWDRGTYVSRETTRAEISIAAGELKFQPRGMKLRGDFTLVKTRSREGADNTWLSIKERDEFDDRR